MKRYANPAIISQDAVRRLPRIVIAFLCLTYTLSGFLGRGPWKTDDLVSFGIMSELARGGTDWLAPQLAGAIPPIDGILPYWIGAWFIQISPAFISADLAARIPFIGMLLLTLTLIWIASFHLARDKEAQPVAFAFGGQAEPIDYARAIADGALLALIATLGLAQLSHETTPANCQLFFTTIILYSYSNPLAPRFKILINSSLGMLGLALSGAPSLAMLFGLAGAVLLLSSPGESKEKFTVFIKILIVSLLIAWISTKLSLWVWRIESPAMNAHEWKNLGRLFIWFTWPTWPLVIWTLWQWRRQIFRLKLPSHHLALPLLFSTISIITTLITRSGDKSLLLALPSLAVLAAFALPTLSRSLSALIDWFTLIFFSGCGITIWVVWIALQTGIPSQPAKNVAKLAPGFEHSFSIIFFSLALLATAAWIRLVIWRTGRHRKVIWKSLILPAGGATLIWLLLMTLWMPLLNYARSYETMVLRASKIMTDATCAYTFDLSSSQVAAFEFHATLKIFNVNAIEKCDWMLVRKDSEHSLKQYLDNSSWKLNGQVSQPADKNSIILIYHHKKLPFLQ